jgi:hypothetical protein
MVMDESKLWAREHHTSVKGEINDGEAEFCATDTKLWDWKNRSMSPVGGYRFRMSTH